MTGLHPSPNDNHSPQVMMVYMGYCNYPFLNLDKTTQGHHRFLISKTLIQGSNRKKTLYYQIHNNAKTFHVWLTRKKEKRYSEIMEKSEHCIVAFCFNAQYSYSVSPTPPTIGVGCNPEHTKAYPKLKTVQDNNVRQIIEYQGLKEQGPLISDTDIKPLSAKPRFALIRNSTVHTQCEITK